jgi:hypothetical protein
MKTIRLSLAVLVADVVAATVQPAVAANVKIIPLVSPMYGDHVGDCHLTKVKGDECGKPDVSVSAAPNSNTVNIVLSKNEKIIIDSEMPRIFAAKLKALGDNPKSSQLAGFSASGKVGGVSVTTGSTEAAFVIDELVKPNAVIPSNANEVETKGSTVIAETRTETYIKATRVSVQLPLSSRTMGSTTGKSAFAAAHPARSVTEGPCRSGENSFSPHRDINRG